MAGRTRDRQRTERRRALQQAILEEQGRTARRRRLLIAGSAIVAVAALALVFALLRDGDDGEAVSAERETTTTAAATTTTLGSAAGKPCVPVAEPPPPPAPTVPVKVGAPPTTLVSEDLRVGNGATVGPNDRVTAHYIGVSCSTGKVFDSSWSRGQAIPFGLNEVIAGWKQGIPGMKVGGQRLLGIPPDLAYGKAGKPPILPDETLWFVVDIIQTQPA